MNLRSRSELIDYDYLHKLNHEELAWLNQFTEEYINASIPKKNALHKTKKERKICYDKNNKRNVDFYNNVIDRNVDFTLLREEYLSSKRKSPQATIEDVEINIDFERLNTILKKLSKNF